MNKIKHILAIFIVLSIFTLGFYILPKTELGRDFLSTTSTNFTEIKDSTIIQDTTPFLEKFQNHLEVINTSYSKRKKRDVWTLGKGRTIIHYLLQAQNFLNENGGSVLKMEQLYNDPTMFQTATLDALDPKGDSLKLILQVSESIFRDNASFISIAFQVTHLTPELIVSLNELDFPYDLLITPFGMSSSFFPDLDRIKNKELVLWILMESQNLDSRHKKLRPIRIHHTEQQIESIINDAKKMVPKAKGIATRFAEQAVEHKQLLQATFTPSKKQSLWFLDLSNNQKSKVLETCQDNSMKCKSIIPYNPSNSTLNDYISKNLRNASRNGISAIIIPLNNESISKIKGIKTKAINQGTSIVNLSTFMKY